MVWQLVTSTQEYGLAQQFGQPARSSGSRTTSLLAPTPRLWTVVARSIAFCLITAAVDGGRSASLLALLMTAVGTVARLILQVALLLAWAMPVVAAMTVWIWLFDCAAASSTTCSA